ncbi:MAG: hypothetical protein NTZ54_11060, partial [Alphaproteobacteria bacterium]|nr:hypothetical protein [Alphaproteobacteria bacterium]
YYDLGSEAGYDAMKAHYHAPRPPVSHGAKAPEAARKFFCELIASLQPSDFETVAGGLSALAKAGSLAGN